MDQVITFHINILKFSPSGFLLFITSGLEPTGNVAKAPAKFTVETFGAGDGDLAITVKGPDGTDYKVDKTFNNDRKKSYSCSYFPDKEGDFMVPILYGGRNIPKSPFKVQIEGFAGDANKVTVAGPGAEPEGVVANRPTDFDIFTEGAGRGKPKQQYGPMTFFGGLSKFLGFRSLSST